MSAIYGDKCKRDSDCSSNVCETVYDQNNNPKGRFCLDTSSKVGRTCEKHADCESGNCKTIYDNEGHVIEQRCTPSSNIEPDNSFIFKDADTSKYGIVNTKFRDKIFKEQKAGPLAKFIAYLVEAIVSLIKGILILLFSIWKLIFQIIANIFLGKTKGDLIFGRMSQKYTDSNGKCTGRLTTLWLPRMIITILLPPFGVFFARGINGIKYILICSVLTCIFYFPGLIYAFIVINNSRTAEQERRYIALKRGKGVVPTKAEEDPIDTFMKS
jgi:uncharacterized membrane protein YqaE (UPF0057 family)